MPPDPPPPILIAFAGPNGAGKSTLRAVLFSDTKIPFVNADEISAATGVGAYEAADLAEEERQRLFNLGFPFMMETILSDPVGAKVAFLHEAMAKGYQVEVHFIGLASSSLSMTRVEIRVSEGGHDVPDDKLINRYPRVLENLARLVGTVDNLTIYDNSEPDDPFRILAIFEGPHLVALSTTLPVWIHFLNLQDLATSTTRALP